MDNSFLQDFLNNREKSPLADAAANTTRRAPEVEPPPVEYEPIEPEDMRNETPRDYYQDDDDDDENTAILSAEEIDVMAESKAVKWGIGTSLAANAINAALMLSPREWQIYYDWKERELDDPDRLPLPPPTVARILRKVAKLEASKEANELSTKEQTMLKKAIKAELKIKNKMGRLNRSGVLGTVADILLAKAAPGVTEGVLRGVNAIMAKITGQR
jgi:hypothetical protein